MALAFGCQLWACDCEMPRAPEEGASSPTGSSEGSKGGAGQDADDGEGDGQAGASGTGDDGDGTSGASGAAGSDGNGAAGSDVAGAGDPDPDPASGSGGAGGGGGSDPRGPGLATLNRNMCVANQPFTLVLDTKGRWGRIGGWLESTAEVAFEDGLPNFRPEDPAGLRVWWSIASLEEGSGWFYGYNETKVTLVHAPGRLEDIDVSGLKFGSEAVGPAFAGDVAVHKWNDQLLAVRVDAVYPGTDMAAAFQCSAIDATWVFATKNEKGKLSFGEPDE